jgi:hypothetical protein
MVKRLFSRRERGAVLVHVAVALVGLVGFSALSIDYGVFWMSRRQAQNSADAGALAGAIALAFDDPTDKTPNGPAVRNAFTATQVNAVFGEAPSVIPETDITFDPCSDDGSDACIQVRVFRTVARGNALPTFFARLLGIADQDIQAFAEAKVVQGNATTCMRPWAVLDKWDEYDISTNGAESEYGNGQIDPDWNQDASFDKYDIPGNQPPLEPDLYVPPTADDPGTGFRLYDDAGNPVDYGRVIELHDGSQDQTSAGWFKSIRLKPDDSGLADYCANIRQCSGVTNIIGQEVSTENGNMPNAIRDCVFGLGNGSLAEDSLVSQDPDAVWDPDYYGEGNGAVVSPLFGPNQSPRIVPLPVISPEDFFAADPSGQETLVVTNILGFFIEGYTGQGGQLRMFGRLVNAPGLLVEGENTVATPSAFLTQIVLIR